jgi:UDP-N-acetylmuramate: L-alanyl-gamma-D-glutamyl-meso-diaminopimelate ligase
MATLAALLKSRGHAVTGSDQNVYPPMSTFLAAEGVHVLEGYSAAHVTGNVDLVVVGNAISRGNPELEEVLDRRLRYCSLPEAVRDMFLWGARPIVIAGTHGKTTTTALTGWLLADGGLDPTVFVGGIALNFGREGSSYRVGAGRDFVIEGDEYDSAYFDKTAKFLKYVPEVAVVNNVEFDHADIYPDLDAVQLAFRRLVTLVPRNGLVILGHDSPGAMALAAHAPSLVETVGLSPDATWSAHDIAATGEGWTRFDVRRRGEPFGRFEIQLLGRHNVRNALAAIAVGARVGASAAAMREAVRGFRGIKRRLETVGTARGVRVIDDFAHHPTAVRETVAALRAGYPSRRIWAVFEPRSASSCRRVFQQAFTDAFGDADETVVAAVYRSTVPALERLDPERLVADLRARGQRARYIPDVGTIVDALVAELRGGDIVVLMSNGAFGGIHRKLLHALESEYAAHS